MLGFFKAQIIITKDMLLEISSMDVSVIGFITFVMILVLAPFTMLVPPFHQFFASLQDLVFTIGWKLINDNT